MKTFFKAILDKNIEESSSKELTVEVALLAMAEVVAVLIKPQPQEELLIATNKPFDDVIITRRKENSSGNYYLLMMYGGFTGTFMGGFSTFKAATMRANRLRQTRCKWEGETE